MDKKENIKLDEILKMLFSVSKSLTIKIVNYFFNEHFDENQDYKIEFTNTESTNVNLEQLRADFFIKIGKVPSFHFEFQLSHTKGMVLRMFEYGYREALKYAEEEKGIKTLHFPKQAVLYLEKGKSIPDELKLKLVFPITEKGEQSIIYKTIVKKAWEIDKEEKIDKGLYSLLPLEIFKLRKKVEKTKTADKEKFSRLSKQILNATIEIIDTATAFINEEKITEEDYTKIIESTTYLFEYFSRNYADLKLSKEVSEVEEYIYTRGKREGKEEGIKEGIKKGREETAINMIKNGLSVELISKVTGLPSETIENLKEEIDSKNN